MTPDCLACGGPRPCSCVEPDFWRDPTVTPERFRRRVRDGWDATAAATTTPHAAKRANADRARLTLPGFVGSSEARRVRGGVSPPPTRVALAVLARDGYAVTYGSTTEHTADVLAALRRARRLGRRGVSATVVRVADGAVLASSRPTDSRAPPAADSIPRTRRAPHGRRAERPLACRPASEQTGVSTRGGGTGRAT